MSTLIDRAVGDRQRPLRDDLVVPFRAGFLRLTVDESARIVKSAARRFRRHNTGRRHVEGEFFAALAAFVTRGADVSAGELRQELRGVLEVRAALERMWPVLTPGPAAPRSVRVAGVVAPRRPQCLRRGTRSPPCSGPGPTTSTTSAGRHPMSPFSMTPVRCSARCRRGTPDRRRRRDPHVRPHRRRRSPGPVADAVENDRPPIAERLAHRRRRPRSGHRTVGAVELERRHRLPSGSPTESSDRAVGRLPHPGPDHGVGRRRDACRDTGTAFPRSVREGDASPEVVSVSTPADVGDAVAAATPALTAERDGMSVVVAVADPMADEVSVALDAAGISHGRAAATGLDAQITVVPISVAKGLEVDGVVVVEPAAIVDSEIQGLRALYVALTRPTQRLVIVHASRCRNHSPPASPPSSTASASPPSSRRSPKFGRRDDVGVRQATTERIKSAAGRRRDCGGCCRPCRRRRGDGGRRRCGA